MFPAAVAAVSFFLGPYRRICFRCGTGALIQEPSADQGTFQDDTQQIGEITIMKYAEATRGRSFILRLEDGEILHEVVEKFAIEKDIKRATIQVIGGANEGSRLVVGPRDSRATPVDPMDHTLDGACEIVGVGTLFPNENGKPMLHLHIACGRNDKTVTGCVRLGVKVWCVMEVVILELMNETAARVFDPKFGFALLEP